MDTMGSVSTAAQPPATALSAYEGRIVECCRTGSFVVESPGASIFLCNAKSKLAATASPRSLLAFLSTISLHHSVSSPILPWQRATADGEAVITNVSGSVPTLEAAEGSRADDWQPCLPRTSDMASRMDDAGVREDRWCSSQSPRVRNGRVSR